MIELLRRQTGYMNGFFVVVKEDKKVVATGFTERAVLSANKVVTTPAPVIVSMRGFNPCLTGFNLYGASPGRSDINDRGRVYGDVQNRFCYALSCKAVVRCARIGIQGLHDNLSVRFVYIGVVLVMGRVI